MNGERYAGAYTDDKLFIQNICHQAIFYGREIFELCGAFSLTYPIWADWEMNFRCFGAREVRKVYVPVTICDYELNGMSTRGDPRFDRDKLRLFVRYLGFGRSILAFCSRVRTHALWRLDRFLGRPFSDRG